MIQIKTANHGDYANRAPANILRQQAGFTFIEMIIVLAIIAIMAGFAVFGINEVREGMRANQAMYQVVESLRNARMMAMSQKRMVLVRFTDINEITMQIQLNNGEYACNNEWWEVHDSCWEDIGSAGSIVPVSFGDPSIKLENGYEFMNDVSEYTPDEDHDEAAPGDAIVFGGKPVIASDRFVFTVDGFMTTVSDFFHPINGTIFIGNKKNNKARAVTILGATGRINIWRWSSGNWRSGI